MRPDLWEVMWKYTTPQQGIIMDIQDLPAGSHDYPSIIHNTPYPSLDNQKCRTTHSAPRLRPQANRDVVSCQITLH